MTSEELQRELRRIQTLAGDDLLGYIRVASADLADRITLLVAAWKRATDIGLHEELASLRTGFAKFIPKVVDGKFIPSMLVMFGGAPSILSIVADTDLSVQKKIADGERFPLLIKNGEKFDTLNVSVPSLTLEQTRQLFRNGAVRPIAEQRAYLTRENAAKVVAATVNVGPVRIDPKTQTVKIGRSIATVADVVKALAAAGFIEPPKMQK